MGEYPIGYRWLGSKGVRSILGDFDAEVMAAVWANHEGSGVTVALVFEALYDRWRGVRQSRTVGAMGRLARKGLLRVESHYGKPVYFPTCTEDEMLDGFLRILQERLGRRYLRPREERDSPGPQSFVQARAKEVAEEITRRNRPESDSFPPNPLAEEMGLP